jgi:hypothetical protein
LQAIEAASAAEGALSGRGLEEIGTHSPRSRVATTSAVHPSASQP